MAADQTIHKVLSKIAANYGKRQGWPDEVLSVWRDGLQHMPDRLLFDASKRWLAEHSRAPTVANIRSIAKSLKPEIGTLTPQGCRRCDQTGWVEVAHHTGTPDGSESRVNTYSAACDCAAGYRLGNGAAARWEAFVERLKADPYTLQVFHSTPERPHLTKWERMTPEQLDRISMSRIGPSAMGSWHKIEPAP